MDKLIGVIGSVGDLQLRTDQDTVDRVNNRYTVVLLGVFVLIVTTSQYVGDPITCWTPAHFTGQMVTYTDDWCWIKGTYYHPIHSHVPHEGEHRQFEVTYYQWIPLFLMVQAFLFYIPSLIWRTCNTNTGIDIHLVIKTASGLNDIVPSEREPILKNIVRYVDNYLSKRRQGCAEASKLVRIQRLLAQKCCMFCTSGRTGNFIWMLYISCKSLYIVNVIGQLFLLNAFIGTQYNLYGFGVLRDLYSSLDWSASPIFPRITLCSFKMRVMGNVQRHTFQCVLPVNLFNEKIYIFIWFWYVFVATITFFNFISWVFGSVKSSRTKYFKKHLVWMERLKEKGNMEHDKKIFQSFVEKYLCPDGYLLIRLVALNTTEFVASEVISALWDNYRRTKPSAPLYPGINQNGGVDDEKRALKEDL